MKCVWPECTREAVVGAYCFEHHDLLVYGGAIEDKELDQLLARVVERARVEVAARYPDNSDLQK